MTRKEMWEEFESQLKREVRTPITMSYDDSIRLAEMGIKDVVKRWKKRLEQEPCEDCISRQAVNDLVDELARAIIDERCCIPRDRSTETIVSDIIHLPPVTPQPKTGHWIVGESEFNINVKCSCCNYIVNYFWSDWNKANYCPNCGAKMESEE